MQSKLILIFSIILAFNLLTGCRQQPSAVNANGANNPPAAPTTAAPSPITVTTAPVLERSLANTIDITGSLEGQEEITVSSEVEGAISQINFDLGSYLKAGDRLLAFDIRELELQVKQAEANVASAEARLGPVGGPSLKTEDHPEVRAAQAALDQAKIEFERTERLLQSGDIPKQEFDRAKSLYDQARARWEVAVATYNIYVANLKQTRTQLSLAQKQLNDGVIHAPISGAVKERLVGKGEYIKKGDKIARIVQIDPLRLRVTVPEQYVNELKAGQSIDFKVESIPDAVFHGSLSRFSPSIDKNSRALLIEASIQNTQLKLKPGMFVRASINTASTGQSLMVPQTAVLNIAGLNKVFVLIDGQARAREVKLGQRDGDLVQIVSGLNAGEQVITNNLDKLADGSPVTK